MPSFKDLLVELEKVINEKKELLKSGTEKTGLMWMDVSERVQFVHQTFCEFLAARWLYGKCIRGDGASEHARSFVLKEFNKLNTWNTKKSRVQEFLEEMLLEEFPLHAAAWSEDWEAMELLLGEGSGCWEQTDTLLRKNVSQYLEWIHGEQWRKKVLRKAAEKGYEKCAWECLRRGAASLSPRDLSVTVHLAAMGKSRQHTSIVEWLLDHGAVDCLDGYKNTFLHSAAESGSAATVEVLLKRLGSGVLNVRNSWKETALHLALQDHNHETAQLLLRQKGIDVSILDVFGYAPLALATKGKCELCMDSILRLGADVDGGGGRSPLLIAAKKDYVSALRFLLENNATVTATDNTGATALHLAARKGSGEALKYLLKHGASADKKDEYGRTPMHYAAKEGSVKALENLLNHDASTIEKDGNEKTPLHYAAEEGRVEAIGFLLNRGASANEKDVHGITPLHYAVKKGSVEAIEFLLKRDASANEKHGVGKTPLHYASEIRSVEAIELLLNRGASADVGDADAKTPMHYAAEWGYVEALELLASHVTSVDATDEGGRSPLHLAAASGRASAVRFLLSKGADDSLRSSEGLTPLDSALRGGHRKCATALREAAGERGILSIRLLMGGNA